MIIPADQLQTAIDFAADLFRDAKRVVALTGAGLSTPSGIPDFRSEGTGLWSRDEPLEVASLSTFRTAPECFYKWFRPLASQIFNAEPNPAHSALAETGLGLAVPLTKGRHRRRKGNQGISRI